jgi:ABC-type spermidine/putrescine transport system permease subunit II
MLRKRSATLFVSWCCLGAVLLVVYLPLVPPILFSTATSEPGGAPTLRWYAALWRNPLLVSAIATSLEVAIIVAVAATLFALGAAMAIRAFGVPRLILALMLLPLFVPGVSMGLATALFFRILGVEASLVTIAIVQTAWALPFATLIVVTAMSGFDPTYLEAAYVSGAGRWRAFVDVELPLISSGVSGAALFSLILSFNETIRTALVQGPLNTVQTYIWSTYRQVGLSPELYALMSLLILLTVALVGVFVMAGARASPEASSREIGIGSFRKTINQ